MASFFTTRLFFISVALVIIAATLPLYVSGYVLGLLTVAFYFGVFAMAWDLLFGFAGEVNFGPTFLIGVGAYTAGILNAQFGWSVYLCIVLGALASVIAGLVLALPALRVRGPYFGLTTLVAVLMLQNFIVVFADLTGGEIGLTIPDVISIDAGTNYWIALGFMTISAAILYGLSQSPIGLVLQASGQDPVQAAGLEHEANRRLRQAVEDRRRDRHEAERDPVIGAGVDGDDVGDGQADLAAGEIGEHHDEVLQHQHRDQRGQAEIRPAHAQSR